MGWISRSELYWVDFSKRVVLDDSVRLITSLLALDMRPRGTAWAEASVINLSCVEAAEASVLSSCADRRCSKTCCSRSQFLGLNLSCAEALHLNELKSKLSTNRLTVARVARS